MKIGLARLLGKDVAMNFPAPWGTDRPAIYHWLATWPNNDEPLPAEAETLPDEPPFDDGQIRWSAGALDGVFGHHMAAAEDESPVEAIMAALKSVLRKPRRQNVEQLYTLLNQASPLSYIDALLAAVAQDCQLPANNLQALVEWLATESPDRNVVKVAMALLAFFPTQKSDQILRTLGAHSEFTLYAVVALGSLLPAEEYERAWLALAKRAEGWGRVQLIERSPEPLSQQSRDWLLREGYRNSVMYEYTAWHCATHGQLLAALQDRPDAALLVGAAEILQALINGGPTRDMHDYAQGAQACECYLRCLLAMAPAEIQHYLAASEIARFAQLQSAEEEAVWDLAQCELLAERANAVMAQPQWSSVINGHLQGSDKSLFNLAVIASRLRQQDPWEAIYARQLADPTDDNWYQLMQTDQPAHITRVIALAEQQLDLAAIASGPGTAMGLGLAYRQHQALDFVLQDLKKFPGMGESLLAVGLRSEVIRNRHMALNALEVWPPADWSPEMLQTLAESVRNEPDEPVRERLQALCARLALTVE
ncbi:hypothetical protein FHU10_1332 [Serratia fonticola]|uniref:Limonene hydroxylase n=1 Tax=Serratia fonticola TaxID=47917 RepID=A0A542BJ87_SERFO|nr:hypothetical protein [Serratia fonticola]TQI78630.1 hypothetical protein FHU09_1118 [Serratia fonticola]TQI99348.1 hypothetical protein FHU11_4934 [Serratia fonticola]TVZ68873.1 hypothetical protein FHU10_1332 [Serratia fonticola]